MLLVFQARLQLTMIALLSLLSCFFTMLLSSYSVFGLTYVLPTELGVNMEYYFLEIVPIVIMLTACVVCTSRVMDYFERRSRRGAQGRPEVERQIDPERENEEAKRSLLFQIGEQLNAIVLLLMMLGCKFYVLAPRSYSVLSVTSALHFFL